MEGPSSYHGPFCTGGTKRQESETYRRMSKSCHGPFCLGGTKRQESESYRRMSNVSIWYRFSHNSHNL